MNQKKQTKGRALPADPNKSLFKFKLSWSPQPDGSLPKTQTWYSYDYSSEREIFPEGIGKDLRLQWKQLLSLCWKHQELYELIKWSRPYSQDNHLYLFMPNWPELTANIALIEEKYSKQLLEGYIKSCDFDDFSFEPVKRSHPRQPGQSPGRSDFRQFYGFKYLQRNDFIITNLATGRLLKVDTYDNLMYHSKNYLHTLFDRSSITEHKTES